MRNEDEYIRYGENIVQKRYGENIVKFICY